jgi:hypothetical protein
MVESPPTATIANLPANAIFPWQSCPVRYPRSSIANRRDVMPRPAKWDQPRRTGRTLEALVSFVNPETREGAVHAPNVWYDFVKVDGRWLLNAYHESQVGAERRTLHGSLGVRNPSVGPEPVDQSRERPFPDSGTVVSYGLWQR